MTGIKRPDQLRIGFAGTGNRGAALIGAMRDLPEAVPHAVYDALPGSASAFAREHALEVVCEQFDELLDHVDLVILGSPVHHHAPQACEALAHDVHVLSEVPAAVSVEQAQALVAAVRSSQAQYAIAENYCYLLPNIIVRELVRKGELGELFYGESDHLADIAPALRNVDGSPRWPYYWWAGRDGHTYPTHSLGPLLQWFNDRVVAVSCVGAGRHTAPEHELQDTTVMLARTVRGGLLRLRFSWLSHRPVAAHFYAVQGTNGAYDAGDPIRGIQPVIYLHGSSPGKTWEPLERFVDELLPGKYVRTSAERGPLYAAKSPLRSFEPADRWLVQDVVDAMLHDRPIDLDVYAGLDMILPAFAAETSIAQAGAWVHVPNPRFFTAGIGSAPGRETPLA